MTVSAQIYDGQIGAADQIDQIKAIQNRVQNWRLIDCSEAALVRMKSALNKEVAALATKMMEVHHRFEEFIELGNPTGAMKAQEEIGKLSTEWKRLKQHLQEIDEALLERSLRSRLIEVLGSERNLNLFDGLVLILILIVITLIVIELLVPLPPATARAFVWADTIISILLLGEFFFRLSLANNKRWFFKRYWIDFVSSLPFNGVIQFGRLARIARFARLIRLLRLVRAIRVLLFVFRGLDTLVRTFELSLLKRSVIIASALLVFGALSMAALEGSAQLKTFNESLWWSFATVVTGGFADLYNPITPTGRIVTVGLILLGLTVTGIFTASLTSVLVDDDSSQLEYRQLQFDHSLKLISHKLDLMTGQTKEAIVDLERVSQLVSRQALDQNLAQVLADSLTQDFHCLQASVHLLEPEQMTLRRLAVSGLPKIAPPDNLAIGEGFVGRVMAELNKADLSMIELAPSQEASLAVQNVTFVCPLVAGGQLLGCLHYVLPTKLVNDQLYANFPLTLAHQAALAFLARSQSASMAAD